MHIIANDEKVFLFPEKNCILHLHLREEWKRVGFPPPCQTAVDWINKRQKSHEEQATFSSVHLQSISVLIQITLKSL